MLTFSGGTRSRGSAVAAALCLGLWLCLGASSAQAADALVVKVSPSPLHLWEQDKARVEIEGPSDLQAVDVTTNLGRIANVRALGNGRFTAEYQTPPQAFPQTAVVAATGRTPRGEWMGWTALPMWGLGDAEVRARPGTQVTVRIGARSYGPVTMGASGVARVPVQVAPGEDEAVEGEHRIPLTLPQSKRVHVFAGQPQVRADKPVQVPVYVVALTPDGQPAALPPPKLDSGEGALTPAKARGAGAWESVWTVPAGKPEELRATVVLEKGTPGAVLTLRRVAGPAATLSLSLSPSVEVVRPGQRPLRVVAQVRDSAGNAAAPEVTFASPLCRFGQMTRAPGRAEVDCQLPTFFEDRDTLEISATAPGEAAPVSARLAVPLLPAEPVKVVASPDRATVTADGMDRVRLLLAAVDAYGNKVPRPAPAVSLSSDVGTLSAPAPAAVPGAYEVEYRAPYLERRDEQLVLSLRSDGLKGQAELTVRGVNRRVWLSPRASFASNLRDVAAPLLTLEAAFRAGDGWGVDVEAGHLWLNPLSASGAQTRGSFTPLWAGAFWKVGLGERWALLLRAQGGAAFVAHQARVDSQPWVQEAAWAPSASLGADVEWRWWRGAPLLGVRGVWVGDPKLATLRGALWGAALCAGYRFELF